MPSFTCATCSQTFTMAQALLDRHPGWTPRRCLACRDAAGAGRPAGAKAARRRTVTATEVLTPAEVLERFHDGPTDGIFTDGGAHPNPGPGGWGAVRVANGEIVEEATGSEPETTNNRMELSALIAGLRMAPPDEPVQVYSDSEICVKTVTTWADQWERAGWKRKTGPIKNLDLVKELHAVSKERPLARVSWVPAHSGWRWNEYADALASARTASSRPASEAP